MGVNFTDPESQLPEFAVDDVVDSTSGKNNVVTPETSQKQFGWFPFRKLPERGVFNWLHRHTYKQLKWWKDIFFDEIDTYATNVNHNITRINKYSVNAYNRRVLYGKSGNHYISEPLRASIDVTVETATWFKEEVISGSFSTDLTNADTGALNLWADGGPWDEDIVELASNYVWYEVFLYAIVNGPINEPVTETGFWIGEYDTYSKARAQIADRHSVSTDVVGIVPVAWVCGKKTGVVAHDFLVIQMRENFYRVSRNPFTLVSPLVVPYAGFKYLHLDVPEYASLGVLPPWGVTEVEFAFTGKRLCNTVNDSKSIIQSLSVADNFTHIYNTDISGVQLNSYFGGSHRMSTGLNGTIGFYADFAKSVPPDPTNAFQIETFNICSFQLSYEWYH